MDEQTTQKVQLLERYYNQACHNLMCYSKNILMLEPKQGYEAEWAETKAECEMLQQMLDELRRR